MPPVRFSVSGIDHLPASALRGYFKGTPIEGRITDFWYSSQKPFGFISVDLPRGMKTHEFLTDARKMRFDGMSVHFEVSINQETIGGGDDRGRRSGRERSISPPLRKSPVREHGRDRERGRARVRSRSRSDSPGRGPRKYREDEHRYGDRRRDERSTSRRHYRREEKRRERSGSRDKGRKDRDRRRRVRSRSASSESSASRRSSRSRSRGRHSSRSRPSRRDDGGRRSHRSPDRKREASRRRTEEGTRRRSPSRERRPRRFSPHGEEKPANRRDRSPPALHHGSLSKREAQRLEELKDEKRMHKLPHALYQEFKALSKRKGGTEGAASSSKGERRRSPPPSAGTANQQPNPKKEEKKEGRFKKSGRSGRRNKGSSGKGGRSRSGSPRTRD